MLECGYFANNLRLLLCPGFAKLNVMKFSKKTISLVAEASDFLHFLRFSPFEISHLTNMSLSVTISSINEVPVRPSDKNF